MRNLVFKKKIKETKQLKKTLDISKLCHTCARARAHTTHTHTDMDTPHDVHAHREKLRNTHRHIHKER